MQTLKDNVAPILAIIVVVFCLGYYLLLSFLPHQNDDTVKLVVPIMASLVTAVIMFYFGSSNQSKAKDDTIATLSNQQRKPE